jgi:hypothetical protein
MVYSNVYMSQRYGACRACLGTGNSRLQPNMDCGSCEGTGFGGGIDDLYDPLRIPRKSDKSERKEFSHDVAIQAILDHWRKGKYRDE